MDNLLSHSRVIAHLSRYSLSQVESPRKSFYVILPPSQQVLLTRTKSIPAIAAAFGCEGFIFVGTKKQFSGSIDSAASSDEHKMDDEIQQQSNAMNSSSFGCQTLGANTMKEAYRIAKDELGCEIIGICGKKRAQSVSLGHTKSFTSRVAFVFLEEDYHSSSPKKQPPNEILTADAENEIEEDLAMFCDRLIYVSSDSPADDSYSSSIHSSSESIYNKQKQVSVELRASIVLHRFAESKWTERLVSN